MMTETAVSTLKRPSRPQGPTVLYIEITMIIYHGKILRDLFLGLIMGRFYGTCNESPVVKWIIYMGRFYVRSKYLRKIFPYNRIREHSNQVRIYV